MCRMAEKTAGRWKQGVTWVIAIVFSGLGGAVLNNIISSRSTIIEYTISRTAVGADQAAVIPDFKVGGNSLQSLYIYTVKLQYSSGPELEGAKLGIDLGTAAVKPVGKIVSDGPSPLFAISCGPFAPGAKTTASVCSIGRLSSNVGAYTVSFATDADTAIGLSIDAKNTHLKQAGAPEGPGANFSLISSFVSLLAGVFLALLGYIFGKSSERIADLSEAVALVSQPALEVDYEGAEGNRVEAHYKNKDQVDVNDIYIRVRVRNVGGRTAKGARVFLTDLQEVHTPHSSRTRLHDTLPLPWAGWAFEPRDIPPGITFYADVVRVSKNKAGWIFSAKWVPSDAELATYSGTYRFKVKATADNAATVACEVDVTYKQDWNTLRAVAVGRPVDTPA